MFWSPNLSPPPKQKKKKERKTLNIHQKKGAKKKGKNNSNVFFRERDERDKTLTCKTAFDKGSKKKKKKKKTRAAPPFSFFRGWRVHPNDYLVVRARRKRRQNREEEEEEKVSTFSSFRKCFKLLGTTRRRSNSDAFFEVLWLALHRRVWFGSSGTETNSKRDASSGIVDRDRA